MVRRHGLATEPTRSELIHGHTRKLWLDAKGRQVGEAYSVKGMAHGVPLATSSDVPIGEPVRTCLRLDFLDCAYRPFMGSGHGGRCRGG